ncbi:hypothetical protein PDL71_11895 [Lacibacter sp. MH-610]|uniref:hypothetical protein n=1 Tax=Lacibacter sp. MH-610 TaxID=3020883 RepID=UPI003892BCC4
MKNTSIFILGWLITKAVIYIFINIAFVDFTAFLKTISFYEQVFILNYLIFAILKFFLRNDFLLSLRLQKSEIFFLFITGIASKNSMLLVLPILSLVEYFHFYEQFCLTLPSEKWDGNEVAEETED